MGRRTPKRHADATTRRRGAWRAALVVPVAVVLALVLALTTDLTLRRPPQERPVEPAEVAPPPGLDLPEPVAAPPVARAAATSPIRAAAVRETLAPLLADRVLGRHVLAAVAGLEGGPRSRVGRGDPGVAVPASTTKLFTAAAALLALGSEHVFTTRVMSERPQRLVLVGGGDPFLGSAAAEPGTWPSRADVGDLAARVARALRAEGVGRVRIGYDDSLFSGPAASPHWLESYVPDVVSPIHALWVDQGIGADDPPALAARAFADALSARGIQVRGRPRSARAGEGARLVAEVDSAPLSEIVEQVLQVSDNEGAEVLLRHVGLATGGAGSFVDGQAGVRRVLGRVGVALDQPSVLWDGSGLSRDNRVGPDLLLDLLQTAAEQDRPQLRPVVTGLSVAGYLGSLDDRLDTGDPRAPGRVRAKTGTLSNVFALAGVAVDATGEPVVFALMADRIRLARTLEARQSMDEAAAALAGCDCTR